MEELEKDQIEFENKFIGAKLSELHPATIIEISGQSMNNIWQWIKSKILQAKITNGLVEVMHAESADKINAFLVNAMRLLDREERFEIAKFLIDRSNSEELKYIENRIKKLKNEILKGELNG